MGILETLTGGATLIGTLLSNKKANTVSGAQDSESVSSASSNGTQNDNQTTKSNSTGVVKTNNTSVDKTKGVTTTTGKTNNTGTSNINTTSTGKETSQGVTTNLGFDSGIMAKLNNLLGGAIDGAGVGGVQGILQDRLQQLASAGANNFDPAAFAANITGQAESAIGGKLEGSLNGLMTQAGGTEGGNSMAALLGSRLRNDATAELAGVSAAARAQGEDILRANQQSQTSQISGLSGDITGSLTGLIQALSGAQGTQVNSQTGTTTGSQSQSGVTTDSGSNSGKSVANTTVKATDKNVQTSNNKVNQTVKGKTTTAQTSTDVNKTQATANQKNGGSSLFDNFSKMLTDSASRA